MMRSRLSSSFMGLLRSRQQKCVMSCKVSDIQLSNLRVGTIFRIHVNVTRGWIRCDFPRSV